MELMVAMPAKIPCNFNHQLDSIINVKARVDG